MEERQSLNNHSASTLAASQPGPSTARPPAKYTVFISHAGEDKATIAIPLREKLRNVGIAAFVDQEDMPCGTKAENAMIAAMESAKVGVIVLSPEFVARKWPIKELMCFLRRREERADGDPDIPMIIPVFYRLTISQLYEEPRLGRLDKEGNPMYHESRFFERMKNGEPEADIGKIKESLQKLHGFMGVRNVVGASNDSAHDMYSKREILLQELCHKIRESVQTETVTETTNMTGPERDNVLRGQVLADSFRKSFPPLSAGVRAVLDFDSRDEHGNPITTEGKVKKRLLEEKNGSTSVTSILGIGGVGKSTILQVLSVDDDVRKRFPDGVHVMKLGKDASSATMFQRICRVLKQSGAQRTEESVRVRNDIDEALSFLESWFDQKKCALFIDDAWVHGIGIPMFSRLCKIGSGAIGNSVLITTREHEIASLASIERIIRLDPRQVRGAKARQILFFHANHQEPNHPNMDASNDSITTILDICAGLPVSLAVAGKNVKKMTIDMPYSKEAAWKRYVSQLVICRDRLLRQDVETYGNLFATFVTAITFLDEKPREETLGFVSRFSFAEMYRRLCVLQKQEAVPSRMLKHLWKAQNEECTEVIATTFVESGMASCEIVRAEAGYVFYLSLHDSLHDFAVAEAKRNGDTKDAHRCLLQGYGSSDAEICRDFGGTRRWWSQKLDPDGYILRHVCRHLVGAGRTSELIRLLMSPQWAERQLKVNRIPCLEADFSLGIKAIQHGLSNVNDEEQSQMETALQLISEAAVLSWPYVSRNLRELWFQIHGRLKGYEVKFREIREYMKWMEAGTPRPQALSVNGFLREAGGVNVRLTVTAFRVRCMSVMNEGERAACGCQNGRIVVVNTIRSEIEKQWRAHSDIVMAIAVGRDGTRIVSGSLDGTAKVWEVETGSCLATFGGHTDVVNDIQVMKDEKRVISVSDDGTAQTWDMNTGEAVSPPFTGHEGPVKCVAVFENGEKVVTGGQDKKLRLWSPTTGGQVGIAFENHHRWVTRVVVTPNEQHIVSGSADGTVRVWDVASHQQIGGSLEGHPYKVSYVAISGDGRRCASACPDGTIRLWDLESRRQICGPLLGNGDMITGVSFLGAGDSIVSSSYGGNVWVWDLRRRKTGRVPHRRGNWVTSVTFLPDGTLAVSGSQDKTLRIWDPTSGQVVGDALKGHSQYVTGVAVTPNGRYVVSVSSDKTLRVWDLQTRELLHILRGHLGAIRCVTVTPQSDRAVTGSIDNTVRLWDLGAKDGSLVVFDMHNAPVERVFVTDDGLRIISVDRDGDVFVWELRTSTVLNQFAMKDAWRLSRREVLEFVGEATSCDDPPLSIRLGGREIRYGEGRNALVLATLESSVRCWALSPDKKTICVGLEDGQVAFLKLETWY